MGRVELKPSNVMPLLPVGNIMWIMRNIGDKKHRLFLTVTSIISIILFLATINNPSLGLAYFSANLAYSLLLRRYYRYWYMVIILTIMPLLYPIILVIANRGLAPAESTLISP